MAAGKALVHELAQATGRSAREVRDAAEQLGIDVQSTTSTLDVEDYQRLRQHLTVQSIARQKVLAERPVRRPPRPIPDYMGNSPMSAPRPLSGPPPQRRVPREETIEQEVARLAAQKGARYSRPKPLSGLAAFIARNPGGNAYLGDSSGTVASEWAKQWQDRWIPDEDAMAWITAGLNGNEAEIAARMTRLDWTPETLSRRLPSGTVLALVRGGYILERLDAMLRE